MARRKSNKIEPAVMTITLNDSFAANTLTTKYVDIMQICSLINRRFYRQGINMAVGGFKVLIGNNPTGSPPVADQPTGIVYLNKLPNTWVMSNSYEKSMRAWLKMTREALSETASVRPRFMDFKIYANEGHHSVGFGQNWLPGGYTAGEWSASKISVPLVSPAGAFNPGETVERELIAVGPSYPGAAAGTGLDAVSLIEGYAASRGLPNISDPNTPADASDIGGGTPENWI